MSQSISPTLQEAPPELLYDGRPYTLLAFPLVRVDDAFQVREGLRKEALHEYCEIIRADLEAAELAAGTDPEYMKYFQPTLPPITVWRDEAGVCRMSSGFHRYSGYKENNCVVIPAFVQAGDKRDAKWDALGANGQHGVPLSPAEKRAAVLEILDDPRWSKKSDRDIARHVGVSHTFVAKLRAAFEVAFKNGEYNPDAIRKLLALLGKNDRDVAAQLKNGDISPGEAEALYEQRLGEREARAAERENRKREKIDAARLASPQSPGDTEDAPPAFDPQTDSPGDRVPPVPPGGKEPISEDFGDDDEWLESMGNYRALKRLNPQAAARFKRDALNWAVLEDSGVFALIKSLTIPKGAEDDDYPLTGAARSLAQLPHPSDWMANLHGYSPFVNQTEWQGSQEAQADEEVFEEVGEDPEDDHEPDLIDQLDDLYPSYQPERGWSGENYE